MKHLDKYILNTFLSKFLLIMLGLLVIIILIDVIDHLNKFIDSKIPQSEIINYYFYSLPWFISIGIPISCLISTIFSLGLMQQQNEITAMKSSGLNIFRISITLLIIGLIISFFSFYFDNYLVTNALNTRNEIEKKYFLKNKSKSIKSTKNIYRQISKNHFLTIHRFSHKTNQASMISLQKKQNNKLISRLDAPIMTWNDIIKSWEIPRYTLRNWENEIEIKATSKDTTIKLNFTPIDLTRELMKPEEMNYNELKKFVTKLKLNGLNEPRWEVNLHFKTAFAATSFLMVLIGIPLSVSRSKSNLALGIGISILFIFLYYASLKFGQSIGIAGQFNPFWSVWIVNIIFFFIGTTMLYHTKT